MNHRQPLHTLFLSMPLRVLTLIVGLMAAMATHAQNFERLSDAEAEQFGQYLYVNADYQTTKAIRSYWAKEVTRLKSMKQLEFAITGTSESVLKVTIPARVLFSANDTILLTSADNFLRPLLRIVKGNDAVATLVVAGFSDNNGSERYLRTISGGRARQIHRWFARQGLGPNDVHSYGFGARVPRFDNDNIGHREKNRRVTLYFVPTKKMVRWARKGML